MRKAIGIDRNFSLLNDGTTGVPGGGTVGQTLIKQSSTQGDAAWVTSLTSVSWTAPGTIAPAAGVTEYTVYYDASGGDIAQTLPAANTLVPNQILEFHLTSTTGKASIAGSLCGLISPIVLAAKGDSVRLKATHALNTYMVC